MVGSALKDMTIAFLCNAFGARLVNFDVGGLALEFDAVGGGILLGYFDESGVWPGGPFNSWRTLKRRKASARIPSSSVSISGLRFGDVLVPPKNFSSGVEVGVWSRRNFAAAICPRKSCAYRLSLPSGWASI
jgi:hypothetical protein